MANLVRAAEIIDQILALVWDAQRICICLCEAGGAMRHFPKRPFVGSLETVLPQKILVEWAADEAGE